MNSILCNDIRKLILLTHIREVCSMRKLGIYLLIVLFSLPLPVAAEFYKYYDEDGNVHFTDDYNNVPVDQRPNVEGYVESTSPEEGTENSDSSNSVQKSGNAPKKSKDTDYASQLQNLDKRKEALDKEYQNLIDENNKLEKIRKSVKTAEDVKKYNQSVDALNKKLQAHDQKRQLYASDVEAYNAKIIEANTSKMKKKPQKKEEQ